VAAVTTTTTPAKPPKQEQEEASTEVTELAPGVLRMQLPIQMPGLGHVNMYCLLDERGATVVDPGLPGDQPWEAVQARLKQAELKVSDVHTVIVTHSHPDHFGGAGRFRSEAGSRIVAHESFNAFGRSQLHAEVSVEWLAPPRSELTPIEEDLANERAEPSWLRDDGPRPRTPWGTETSGPGPEQRARFEKMRDQGLLPRLTHTVRHGSVIKLGKREWFVWHTPGHTADHVCLHAPDDGLLLAGDHVLPSITPHISGLGGISDSLQAFYDSLERVRELRNVKRCLPAHGHPFDDLPGRVDAIRRHHDERLDKLKAISKRLGPATVRDLSHELFHPRSWGQMAESETFAHLEHLRLHKQAESHAAEDGQLVFETDAPSAG
jgi:glyoxylase-like metal-dependent hydrolase (beta-lactamase superfamily II)